MEIRFDKASVGITDPDQRDPISGERVLVIIDGDAGGFRVVVPLTPSAIKLLHDQTSPVTIAAAGDLPAPVPLAP